jgi:hypothetical protein
LSEQADTFLLEATELGRTKDAARGRVFLFGSYPAPVLARKTINY